MGSGLRDCCDGVDGGAGDGGKKNMLFLLKCSQSLGAGCYVEQNRIIILCSSNLPHHIY